MAREESGMVGRVEWKWGKLGGEEVWPPLGLCRGEPVMKLDSNRRITTTTTTIPEETRFQHCEVVAVAERPLYTLIKLI